MSEPVTLTVPARTEYIALARTIAAAMSARADLTIDRLEDVRLAVDEAVTQVIAVAIDGGTVMCSFTLDDADLRIVVSGTTLSTDPPPQDTFGWTVLRALVDDVTASAGDGIIRLDLRIRRSVPVEA